MPQSLTICGKGVGREGRGGKGAREERTGLGKGGVSSGSMRSPRENAHAQPQSLLRKALHEICACR